MYIMAKKAIIIGAGPAGLTAAYELLKRTDIQPVLLEKSGELGGISRTVNFKGNRIDIGGHRFFSKSDRVMHWWLQILPLEETGERGRTIHYHNQSRELPGRPPAGSSTALGPEQPAGAPSTSSRPTPGPADPDKVMLIRRRLSRIYFLRKFFNYPIRLSVDTLRKLGLSRTMAILLSYIKARLFPRPQPRSLEDFLIGRFGFRLYEIFFKDYTEKVWGVPCSSISAEWGAQRIKGVSFSAALRHAVRSARQSGKDKGGIYQKDTETSQIEQFMYPKFGPGQLWEEVARQVQAMGGEIHCHQDVQAIDTTAGRVLSIESVNSQTGQCSTFEGDYFFSTMPVSELIAGIKQPVPPAVKEVAAGLQYRDFITVGVLLKELAAPGKRIGEFQPLSLKDTWIYIQEKEVKVGRLQLFNNWSPFLVKDPSTTWLGMEYFCNKGDEFWQRSDEAIRQFATEELEKIGLARQKDVLDTVVIRMEKTYPAYFGTYQRFDLIRDYTDSFANLFLIGRNGMHKYNNSDHSMLTAMVAVDNICNGITDKSNIWSINTEQEYHEEGSTTTS
ncbi:MAG TPA: NAD(P)/FAD-dependent oxidoreductase [Puia sp.]|nr:NAD(P)/FAD-dependent oxidoreductase [Puia sp.]